jgi:cold shock CspA family protein
MKTRDSAKAETGKEYFFHRSAVSGDEFEDLREGDRVEFDTGQGPKGPRRRERSPRIHLGRGPLWTTGLGP